MTIFVPEMLAPSSTDGFLHSNLQTGVPRITPPTASMFNCWTKSQRRVHYSVLFPTPSSWRHISPDLFAWQVLRTKKKKGTEETTGETSINRYLKINYLWEKRTLTERWLKAQINQMVSMQRLNLLQMQIREDLSKFSSSPKPGYLWLQKVIFCYKKGSSMERAWCWSQWPQACSTTGMVYSRPSDPRQNQARFKRL